MRFRSVIASGLAALGFLSPLTVHAQDSLTLRKALAIGLGRAPELAIARAKVDAADAQTASAVAGYLPTLSGTASGQGAAFRDVEPLLPTSLDLVRTTTYTTTGAVSAALRFTVYDFGRTSNNVAAGEANAAATTESLHATKADVIGSIANAYLTSFYKDELRAMTNVTVQNREKLVALAKAQVQAGLQPQLEELRASSRLEAARRLLASAETDANDARAALATLVKIHPLAAVAAPRLPAVDADVAHATRAAEARREPLLAAAAAVASKDAAWRAARARYRPTIALNLDGSQRWLDGTAAPVGTNTRTGTATLLVTVPIFDYSIPVGVAAAAADLANTEGALAQTARDVAGEAERAALAVRGAESEVDHAKKAAEAATTVFAIVEARYERGLATPLELIDAESSDADARTARTNAELERALAVVRLLVATGSAHRLVEEAS
jgi:outer membrane protein TolC